MAQIYQQESGAWALQTDDGTIRTFATEQEARMAERTSAEQEYETTFRAMQDLARTLLTQVATLRRLRTNPLNGIETKIAAAASAGDLVGNSTMTKQVFTIAIAVADRLEVVLAAPVADGLPTLEDVIEWRG